MDVVSETLGRYQLKEHLALGGMAELFLAETLGAHGFVKTVVIKRILPHLAADEQFRSMFINEAKITAQLTYPKIGQTIELGTADNQLFIVMEYIDGVDALAILRECAKRKERIPQELAVYIAAEVLDALHFAHELHDESGAPLRIVHRDVSPSNILLSVRGAVKLVDFGIASGALQDGHTSEEMLKGKLSYLSPEQVLREEVTQSSDIFSAGVVLAEMLIGKRLFQGPNDTDILSMVRDVSLVHLDEAGKDIEPDLNSIVRKALRKRSSDRYESAVEFRDALHEWLFRQRKRVTNTQVAALVDSHYKSAVAGRKKSLAKNLQGSGGLAALPALTPPLEGLAESESPYGALELSDDTAPPPVESGAYGEGMDLMGMDLFNPHAPPTGEDAEGSIPKAASHAPSRAAQVQQGSEQSGTLAATPVVGLLIFFSLHEQSGKLIVTQGDQRKEVTLKKGVIESVSSDENDEPFASFLVQEKHVSNDELDMARAMMPRYDDSLEDTLMGLGLMTSENLLAARTSQVRKRLVELCSWTEGEFQWLEGATCPDPAFRPKDLDVFEAYGAGALATSRTNVEAWLALRGHVTLTHNPKNTFPPEFFQVGLGARAYLESIDGTKTVQELVDDTSPDEKGLYNLRILFLLVNAGLLKEAPPGPRS